MQARPNVSRSSKDHNRKSSTGYRSFRPIGPVLRAREREPFQSPASSLSERFRDRSARLLALDIELVGFYHLVCRPRATRISSDIAA